MRDAAISYCHVFIAAHHYLRASVSSLSGHRPEAAPGRHQASYEMEGHREMHSSYQSMAGQRRFLSAIYCLGLIHHGLRMNTGKLLHHDEI